MKKEEFPTFLNEQPAIIFGRTGRELLIITIGLGVGFLTWARFPIDIHGNVIADDIVKGLVVLTIVAVAGTVAFIKAATRPLEEWAFVWLFYIIVPKVYIYMPVEESLLPATQTGATGQSETRSRFDDDDFDDD